MEKAYDPTYVHFDKRGNMQQKNINAFIKGTSQTFLVLAGDVDRTSSVQLAKYVILLICFGLDRGIFTFKDRDWMYEALE